MARPRAFDELQVTRRARGAFHEHGYAATSVAQLTAATGLQRSSLYGAFGDKRGLFLTAFRQYCDEEMRTVEAELAGGDPALARLAGHLHAKTDDPAASRRGCMLAKVTAELASEDAEVAQLSAAAYGIYERALVDCFRAAQAAGEVRDDIEPAAGGALLLAVLRGIEALGRAGHSKAALRMIADTALASVAVEGA